MRVYTRCNTYIRALFRRSRAGIQCSGVGLGLGGCTTIMAYPLLRLYSSRISPPVTCLRIIFLMLRQPQHGYRDSLCLAAAKSSFYFISSKKIYYIQYSQPSSRRCGHPNCVWDMTMASFKALDFLNRALMTAYVARNVSRTVNVTGPFYMWL